MLLFYLIVGVTNGVLKQTLIDVFFQRKTVYFWLRRWEESGSLEAHHRQHYERATTSEEDAAIVASHSADPFLSTRVSSSNYSVSIS